MRPSWHPTPDMLQESENMSFRFLAVLLMLGTVCANADEVPAEPSADQILRYEARGGTMLASADVPWERYTEIQLERADVSFREGWKSDQKRLNNTLVREADLERIRSDMSEMLNEVLTHRISSTDDYTVTDSGGPNVLRLSPRISKLDIEAPGRLQDIVGDVLVDGKGSMVLVMEISDSESGELLASGWRLEVDPDKGFMDLATEANNKTAFKRMMREWSEWLFALLGHVKAARAGSGPSA